MARPSNTETRREEIVLGLQRAMAERGYEKASIAAIAEAAALTPGLVHYHFDSKQEILLALLDRLARIWRGRAAALNPVSPRERLGALLDAWLALDDSSDRDAVACWVALGAEAIRQPEVRAPYERAVRAAHAELEDAVHGCLAAEGRATGDSPQIAAGLMAAISGFMQLGVATSGVVPAGTAARTLREMAFGAIEAQPRGALPVKETR
jgi:TetR/AcrR family transcriptional regulator, transcriptional repressor of bet genes